LVESFRVRKIDDVENMGNIVEDLCNEELHGEMSYISKRCERVHWGIWV
jgi:hypothetical protein